MDPTRKERRQAIEVQKAAAAEKVNKACSRAQADLEMLSGRVIFHDELGLEVQVSEKDRVKMEKSLRAVIREHCG